MAKFTELPIITNATITDNHVFAVATNSTTDQLTLDELQKSMTGLTARTSNGFSIIGNATPSGITVGDNGFVGIDNTNPVFALHIGDYGGVTQPETRITSSTNRQAVYTLSDSNIYWQTIKKASDTDYYIQASEDGSTYTGVVNIDKNGNFGIFDGSSALTNKFYVSGGDIKFESGNSGIVFDPGTSEIKTSANGDILYLNKSNNDDVVIGDNVVYVDNNGSTPYVGINNITPIYPLDISGAGVMARLRNTASSSSTLAITNSNATGYVNLSNVNFSFGPSAGASTNNILINTSTKKVGLGSISPDNKLHVYSTENRITKFENNQSTISEVFQTNNYTGNATGPLNTIYTFARADGTGPTQNIAKWGIGLYDDGSTNNYIDNFVFRVDADTASLSSIKAALNRNGDLDIQGSLTTNSQYTKGKFVQIHQTRVTGDAVYFNPFYPDSNTNPSGSNDFHSPFGIAPFNGRLEKIQIFTSDTDISTLNAGNPRFEFSVVTPLNDNTNGFVSGFSISPPSAPTALPVSGIVGQISLSNANTPNVVYTYGRSQFSGVTTFNSGQLLQYRICESDGIKTVAPVDFTVVSTISYTVT